MSQIGVVAKFVHHNQYQYSSVTMLSTTHAYISCYIYMFADNTSDYEHTHILKIFPIYENY